jgi:hypothetical protein
MLDVKPGLVVAKVAIAEGTLLFTKGLVVGEEVLVFFPDPA